MVDLNLGDQCKVDMVYRTPEGTPKWRLGNDAPNERTSSGGGPYAVGAGRTPIWISMVATSQYADSRTMAPLANSYTMLAATLTGLPVAGIPRNGPLCVPLNSTSSMMTSPSW